MMNDLMDSQAQQMDLKQTTRPNHQFFLLFYNLS